MSEWEEEREEEKGKRKGWEEKGTKGVRENRRKRRHLTMPSSFSDFPEIHPRAQKLFLHHEVGIRWLVTLKLFFRWS